MYPPCGADTAPGPSATSVAETSSTTFMRYCAFSPDVKQARSRQYDGDPWPMTGGSFQSRAMMGEATSRSICMYEQAVTQ